MRAITILGAANLCSATLAGVLMATAIWPAVAAWSKAPESGTQEWLSKIERADTPLPTEILLAGVRSSRESQAAEIAFWETIKESTDPTEYKAYLQAFPEGIFAPLARARVRLYRQGNPAPNPEPQPAPARKTEPAPAPVVPEPAKESKPAPVNTAPVPATGRDIFRDCPICPEMVKLPAGSFQMGTSDGDPTERPVRQVAIGTPFAIGRFEITVAQWTVCFSDGACTFETRATADPERTAIRNVSWDDAMRYSAWLSRKSGRKYRLPSEAEWEYAARAGTSGQYWWGDKPGADKANCKDCGGPWSRKAPAPIGSHAPNPFGLHDMNGGVAEWTADCWENSYTGAPRDGGARNASGCAQRVLRGGSWRNEAVYLRSASRSFYDSDVRYLVNGFRVAASVN